MPDRPMEVLIAKPALTSALAFAAKFAARNGVHPVYEAVKLTATPKGLSLCATDLETCATVTAEGADVIGPGETCVSAARLLSAVQKVRGDELRLTYADRTLVLHVKRTRMEIPAIDPLDFPQIPNEPATASLPASELARCFRVIEYAMARERMRFALNGAFLSADDGRLLVVATDGRRLATARAAITGTLAGPIVGRKAIQLVAIALPTEGDVSIGAGAAFVSFSWTGHTIVTRKLDGSFPDYRGVIPQSPPYHVEVDREDLLAAIDAAIVVVSKDAAAARLIVTPGSMAVEAKSNEGQSRVELDAGTDATDTLGLNPEFLRELVATVKGDRIVLQWASPKTPVLVEDGTSAHVLMPVTLE